MKNGSTYIIFSFLLVCLLSFKTIGQDVHFSQNAAANLYVNPALTGIMDGDYRGVLVYRNQWGSVTAGTPFRTIYGSFDMKFRGGSSNNYLGAGLMIYSDQAGESNMFSTNHIELSAAYNMSITENGVLSAGLIGGVINQGFSESDAQFGSQWNGSEPDPTMASGEVLPNTSVFYPTLGAGLMFYSAMDTRTNLYVGGGVYHINTPTVSFTDVQGRLASKITAQLGGSYKLNRTIDIVPSAFLFLQGKAFGTNFGSLVRYVFEDADSYKGAVEKAFGIGAHLRLVGNQDKAVITDAIIFHCKLDFESFRVGLSYDVNVSALQVATAKRGGFEVSLTYTAGERDQRGGRLECPKF